MATELRNTADVDLSTSRRALILVWQNPRTRRFSKVGQLDALPGGGYAFHYLSTATDDPEFIALDEFPELEGVYVSDEVPAFFANRILATERRGYDTYLNWLGVAGFEERDIPLEVLARTGGGRATDTFHLVDPPLDASGSFTSRFFVSGLRYTPDINAVLATIHDGARLRLELEETNAQNPKAVLINTEDGQKLGYVPDWLCGEVHARLTDRWELAAVAERVNPGAPAHVRVLCRIDARAG